MPRTSASQPSGCTLGRAPVLVVRVGPRVGIGSAPTRLTSSRRGGRDLSARIGYASARSATFRLSGDRHYGDHAPPHDRRRMARRLRAGSPSATVPFTTLSGSPVKALYTAADAPGDPGHPGVYPYTRGVYPSMYRGRLWTMRQFAGFGTAEETNERFRYLLAHGQDGLSTAFDMPSLMGYDSDHALSRGEVGREGVAVDTLDDMAHAVRRHRPRRDLGLDDDQRARRRDARLLRRRRRGARDPGRAPARDDPGRHPQGVHRPEGMVLPRRSRDAPVRRHDRVVHRADAALASDQRVGLPHPRGRIDRRAGARVHDQGRPDLRRAGDRARSRRRRLRAAPELLLQRAGRLLRGDRQVPRRPAHLGARAARALRRAGPALVADALPHADRRRRR